MNRPPQIRLSLDELVIDNFAGGGGASEGIEQAIGRHIDIAINHDPEAIAMHKANHPNTLHYCEDVFKVDPVEVCKGRPVGLAWFSPDCKHFSKAKGGLPVNKNIRGLAWVAVRYAKTVKPRVLYLENVEEFKDWGPLLENGKPCPLRKGLTFRRFVRELEKCGYQVAWKELRACDYGAPTIRKRLFIIARCDGQPIVWPEETHGEGLQPYKTAAECIDWNIPCPSIFTRKRPLAKNTLNRIAKGVMRYVVENAAPFIVPIANYNGSVRVHNINEPLRTITARPKGGSFALVSAFLAKHYSGVIGHGLQQPIGTVTTVDHHSLVSCYLLNHKGSTRRMRDIRQPVPSICAGGTHASMVAALLAPYYGSGSGETGRDLMDPAPTITSKDRLQLITVNIDGQSFVISDIGMRMLQPRELYKAQGFPDDYKINIEHQGKIMPKYAQVRMCGNSVSPPVAAAIIRANTWSTESQVSAPLP